MFLVATACATSQTVRNFMHIGLAYDEATRSEQIISNRYHRLQTGTSQSILPVPDLNASEHMAPAARLFRSLNLPVPDFANHWWQVNQLLSHADHSFSADSKYALLCKLEACPRLAWPNKFRFARAGCLPQSSTDTSGRGPVLVTSAIMILGLLLCVPEGIAWIFCAQRKVTSAEQIFSWCLRYKGCLRGQDHPELAAQHLAFARVLKKFGFLANAHAHAETALSQLTEYFGPNHTRSLQAQHTLGTICLEEGQLSAAERCFKTALAGPAASWSNLPYCTLLLDASKLYLQQGSIVPAKELCHQAVNLSQAQYDRQTALKRATFGLAGDTLRSGAVLCESLDALASVYQTIGRDLDAVAVLERLLAQKKHWGASASYRQTAEKLFELYTRLGCGEKACIADRERSHLSQGEKVDRAVLNFFQRARRKQLATASSTE